MESSNSFDDKIKITSSDSYKDKSNHSNEKSRNASKFKKLIGKNSTKIIPRLISLIRDTKKSEKRVNLKLVFLLLFFCN